MSYKPVTHVIFDMDGTLLDTEPKYEAVLTDISKSHGIEYTAEMKIKVLGTTTTDCARIFVQEFGMPLSEEEFAEMYNQKCRMALANSPLLPGVEKFVRHLHKHNIPFAIATSSSCEMAHIKMAHLKEFFDLFHHKVMGCTDPEVKFGKPHPDIFLVCASRFDDNPDPSKCLVIEDAPNGGRAAVDAGMQVVLVPDPKTDRKFCAMATMIIDSLEQFKPEQFGLPPY